MPKIDVYNIEGKKVSNIELADSVFGIEPNEKVELPETVSNHLLVQRDQDTQLQKAIEILKK